MNTTLRGLLPALAAACLAGCGAGVEDPAESTNSAQAVDAAPRAQLAIRGTFDPGGPGPLAPPDGPTVDTACTSFATGSLVATPSTIAHGSSATLAWSVSMPSYCTGPRTITVFGQTVGTQGSIMVAPLTTTTYTLAIAGMTLASATVTVELPKIVRIKGNTSEWRALLIASLLISDTTVVLAHDVDMDLTGLQTIRIARGVTFTSEAPPVGYAPAERGTAASGAPVRTAAIGGTSLKDIRPARDARNPGPRVYTTSRPRPLFMMSCDDSALSADNVKIHGFRIHGPHFDPMEGDDNLERAIMVESCRGTEISNMEIAGWSGQAIYVVDSNGRQSSPDQVRIHDNYLHHNQHVGGNGYGVDVAAGAQVLIERNVFDHNRHAIAASGADGTGYVARFNLVLAGGGYHQSYPVYGDYYTHQFDVHGNENCGILDLFSDSLWNCGQAGEKFEFTHNAFQYTRGLAIKVRGNPAVGATVAHNVFAHDSRGDAIAQNGGAGAGDNITTPLDVQGNNKFGIQTYGEYGVCDLDADGVDDLFLATGRSWWYSSGGRGHWVFLAAQDARLHEVGLGDFDGDGRCDVFQVHAYDFVISSGGTAPWRSLGTYAVPFDQLRFGDFNGDGVQDVFRRAPDGQWYAISPGRYDWTALASSSFPLDKLRFGDFDGDRVTDVLAVQGGRWSVSWGGRSAWAQLNPALADAVQPLSAGDVNADGIDDVLRYVPSDDGLTGRWDVSWGGATGWVQLATLSWQDTEVARLVKPARFVRWFAGRFDAWAGTDVLALDTERKGHLHNRLAPGFVPHGPYAH